MTPAAVMVIRPRLAGPPVTILALLIIEVVIGKNLVGIEVVDVILVLSAIPRPVIVKAAI